MSDTINTILCGVDLDDQTGARSAIGWSHELAVLTGAALHLLGVSTPTSAERSPELIAEIHRDALAELTSDSPPADALTHLHTASNGLADAARSLSRTVAPDLVVVASHDTEGITTLGLRGTAHTLAHRLDVPVAAVPHLGGPLHDGTWVVGVDGSELSSRALAWTKAVAAATGSRCCAVYSVDDIYDTFETHGWYGGESESVRHSIAADPVVDLVEREGDDPAETLRAVAAEREAAAVVVAARDRGSLGGALLGIVPDHLLHQPSGPVVVLPHAHLTRHVVEHTGTTS